VFSYPQNYIGQFPFLFTYSIPSLCAGLLVHALEINGSLDWSAGGGETRDGAHQVTFYITLVL
jgi:hypothetical protein